VRAGCNPVAGSSKATTCASRTTRAPPSTGAPICAGASRACAGGSGGITSTLYFAGHALWNYFTTPLLLTRCEIEEHGRTMAVTFPAGIATHSRRQRFHFDESGLLTRLEYTAEVFGKWARGRHECRNHRSFDGLVFPTSRRVTLGPLPRPTIIWIEVDDVTCLRE
jgi:hypothetical protein